MSSSSSTSPAKSTSSWQLLDIPQRAIQSCIPLVTINDSEYLVQTKGKAFQKYDVFEDEWSRYPISVPKELKRKKWEIKAYDSTTQSLYVLNGAEYDPRGTVLTEFDVNTGAIRSVFSDLPLRTDTVIVIDNELHLFGRNDDVYYRHLVINKRLGDNQTFDSKPIVMKEIRNYTRYPVVHSPSRNSILCLTENGKDRVIAEYSLSIKQWEMRNCYGLPGGRYANLDWKLILCSADGRYLIISGDNICCDQNSGFLIYDLNENKLKPKISAVVCPVACPDSLVDKFRLMSMKDKWEEEMATFGFVRRCFHSEELEGVQFPPRYIIDLMAKWVEMEYIHLMQAKGVNIGHWKMSISEILKSKIDEQLIK